MSHYQTVVQNIEALGIMPDRAPSLEPMRQGLARLDLSIDPARVVIVAGTNGKGSVSAILEALCTAAGERVGLYTSPHLVDTAERIRVSGQDISHTDFICVYDAVVQRTQGIVLSHFEVLTLMAAWYFFSGDGFTKVDRAIFEVGLGGTWDATNAIPHSNVIVTSIGLDHTNLLGNTFTTVAENKFGVVTGPMSVTCAPLPHEAELVAARTEKKFGGTWVHVPEVKHVEVEHLASGEPVFHLQTKWGIAASALPGLRGAQNTLTALTAFEMLGFDPTKYLSGLATVSWPGRMQRIELVPPVHCRVYVSGDHNPQGIASLVELLKYYPRRKLHLVAGVGHDKDQAGVLAALFNLPNTRVYLTETPFRGRKIADYDARWSEQAAFVSAVPKEALLKACSRAAADDMVVVTGSLYLVGHVLGWASATR